MKKIFIASSIVAITLIGCAKKRTCTETQTTTYGGSVTTSTVVTVYDKLTPREKKDIENNGTYNVTGTGYSQDSKTECK